VDGLIQQDHKEEEMRSENQVEEQPEVTERMSVDGGNRKKGPFTCLSGKSTARKFIPTSSAIVL